MGRHAQGFKVRWPGDGTRASVRFRHKGERYELGLGDFALSGGGRDQRAAQEAAAKRYAEVVSGRSRTTKAARLGLKIAPAFPDLLAVFIADMKGAYDDETRKTWEVYARKFVDHFGSLTGITEASVGDYSRARLRVVLRSTVSKERHCLGVFARWCREQGYLADVPPFPSMPERATGVRSGTQRAKPVEVTPEEIARFIASLPEKSTRAGKAGQGRFPVRAYFEALWFTGLRPETIESLRVPEHFAVGRETLTITDEIDKTRFGRELTLTPGARRALDRVAPEVGLIFGHHNWSKQLAKAAVKANMPKGFAPYDLRHARAVSMLEATGDDLLGVGYMLGHKRTTTTDRYLGKSKRAGDRVAMAVGAEEFSGDDSGDEDETELRNQGDRRGLNPRQLEPQATRADDGADKQGASDHAEGAGGHVEASSSDVSGDEPPKRGPAKFAADFDMADRFAFALEAAS